MTIENVVVKDSPLTGERINSIVTELNTVYAGKNVFFVTEKPAIAGYSTIYIGKTSAFDEYGSFAGVAETVDSGNKNKTDQAFVLLDFSAVNETIISSICHETDHLFGILDHGGDGLARYAADDEEEDKPQTIANKTLAGQWFIGENEDFDTVKDVIFNDTDGCLDISAGGYGMGVILKIC